MFNLGVQIHWIDQIKQFLENHYSLTVSFLHSDMKPAVHSSWMRCLILPLSSALVERTLWGGEAELGIINGVGRELNMVGGRGGGADLEEEVPVFAVWVISVVKAESPKLSVKATKGHGWPSDITVPRRLWPTDKNVDGVEVTILHTCNTQYLWTDTTRLDRDKNSITLTECKPKQP